MSPRSIDSPQTGSMHPWQRAFHDLQQAIDHRDLASLQAALEWMQKRRLFLPPLEWVELARQVEKIEDGGFLREIWLQLEQKETTGTLGYLYGPALTAFGRAAIACGDPDILKLILKKVGTAGPHQHLGSGWRILMKQALEMRAVAMLRVLAEVVHDAGGHLHIQDVEDSVLLLIECNEVEILKLMLGHLPVGPVWAASWERVGSAILTAAVKPSVPNSDLVVALLEVTHKKRCGLSPEHYRLALGGAGRMGDEGLYRKIIDHSLRWGGFDANKDDLLPIAHFCISNIGDKTAFLRITLEYLKNEILAPMDYEQLFRTCVQHVAVLSIGFLSERLADEQTGPVSLRSPIWQSLLSHASSVLPADQCGSVALALWHACTKTGHPPSPALCAQAMEIFVTASHAEGIRAVGQLMKERQLFLVVAIWRQLLSSALSTAEFSASAVQALWEASEPSHGFFQQSHWNGFTDLKERHQSEEVQYVVPGAAQRKSQYSQAEQIVHAFVQGDWQSFDQLLSGAIEKSVGWSLSAGERITTALGKDRDDRRMGAFWRMARALTRPDDYKTFRFLVQQVNKDDPDVWLEEMFDIWEPSEDTLRMRDAMGGEHQTWISFIQAASEAGNEALLLRIVRRLDWLHDPTRYEHLGTIQTVLRRARYKLASENIAAEIAGIIHGKHWNPNDFLGVMSAWPPGFVRGHGSRFDGAARCLMKWLINRYFDEKSNDFENSLELVAAGLSSLPRHSELAWCSFLGRGWDVMMARIHQYYQGLWRESIGRLVHPNITPRVFLSKALSGEVLQCFTSFISKSSAHARVSPNGLDSSSNAQAIELVNYIASNLEDYLDGKGLTEEEFWEGLHLQCANTRPETMEKTEQRSFLRFCLRNMESSLQALIGKDLSLKIHDGKGRFTEDFLTTIVDQDASNDEKLRTAEFAMEFLGDLSQLGSTLNPGSITSANLTKRVRTVLAGGLTDYTPQVTLTDALSIAIPDAGRRELLDPILEDVTRNIRSALSQVEEDRRFVSITLTRGTGGRSGFAVLEIWNAKPRKYLPNAASTSLGLKSIQRRMNLLFNGTPNGRGSASFSETTDPFNHQPCFVTRLNFPLAVQRERMITETLNTDTPDTDHD